MAKEGPGKVLYDELQGLAQFVSIHHYQSSYHVSGDHLFGHPIITLYPVQKTADQLDAQGSSLRKVVHRPILDIEIIRNRLYARCYLGMFKKGSQAGHKDINATEGGEVQLQNIHLMNLGNPFKAMLWCEDYLANKEHDSGSVAPSPVVRTFLVPLADADMMLKQENGVRALDQDRGSGQFGNTGGGNIYDTILHPLAGTLVSFFAEYEDYNAELGKKGQGVLPMAALQQHLTGHSGDLRQMTSSGIAAQHGRKKHEAKFTKDYQDSLTAYSASITETDFTDATSGTGVKMGKYSKNAFDLSQFPDVVSAAQGSLSHGEVSAEVAKLIARWHQLRMSLKKTIKAQKSKAKPIAPEPHSSSSNSSESKKEQEESRGEEKDISKSESKQQAPSMMEGVAAEVVILKSWFDITENDGGGDCLYHALEGGNIHDIAGYRAGFAQHRREMAGSEQQSNRNTHEMLASLAATVGIGESVDMLRGVESVDNALYSEMLEIPGMYAGPAEIDQWCAMHHQNVVVIDAPHRDVVRYTPDGNAVLLNLRDHPEQVQQLREIVAGDAIVLYKSTNHYERITGISDTFPAAG